MVILIRKLQHASITSEEKEIALLSQQTSANSDDAIPETYSRAGRDSSPGNLAGTSCFALDQRGLDERLEQEQSRTTISLSRLFQTR